MDTSPHERSFLCRDEDLLSCEPVRVAHRGWIFRIPSYILLGAGLSVLVVIALPFSAVSSSRGVSTYKDVIEVVSAAAQKYTVHENKNAFAPYGAEDIDPTGCEVASGDECQQRCTEDTRCDCVTFQQSLHLCWKRHACVLSNMTSEFNVGYTVFMKGRNQPRAEVASHDNSNLSPVYIRHNDTNAFSPYGAVDIDNTDGAHVGSEEACQQRCTDDSMCECATYRPATGTCWKRCGCDVSKMTSAYNVGFIVFIKETSGATQCPIPDANNEMLADDALDKGTHTPSVAAPKVKPNDHLASVSYTRQDDKNAFSPYGAVNIDSSDGVQVGSEVECQQRCTHDARCECVTFSHATNACWKRCDCNVSKMTSAYNDGFTVFIKEHGASEQCPRPCVNNDTLRDDALEMINQTILLLPYTATLVWSDEFSGLTLNASNWEETEDGIVHNGELQMYRRNAGNAQVADGSLRIVARCENYLGKEFTSAKLHSRVMFQAGHRVEARVRMSTGKGTWPAFWMMGYGADPWPKIGEIDILEYTGCIQDLAMGNLHFENHHGEDPIRAYTKRSLDVQEWHTYRVDWVNFGMTFYVDDEVVGIVPAQSCIDDWPYNAHPYYIILNLAVGGSLGGSCLQDGTKPQCNEFMDVDWVRAFKLE